MVTLQLFVNAEQDGNIVCPPDYRIDARNAASDAVLL